MTICSAIRSAIWLATLLTAACGARPPHAVTPRAAPTSPSLATAPTGAATTPTGTAPTGTAHLTLTTICRDIRRGAASTDLQGPFALEIRNTGAAPAVIEEVTGFNLDLPTEVSHNSDANASFTLRRVGVAVGKQRYSCAEATPLQVPTVRLGPGAAYRSPVTLYDLAALELGQYEARVDYAPRRLRGSTCRFEVVP